MSSKACSGIEHVVLFSSKFMSSSSKEESEKKIKESFQKNDTLHASLLHCPLRQNTENQPVVKKKKVSDPFTPANTQPFFIFIFASEEAELVEMIQNHIEERTKKDAEKAPKKPYFYYYSVALEEGASSSLSCDAKVKLAEVFPSANNNTSESSTNKSLVFSRSHALRNEKRLSAHQQQNGSNNAANDHHAALTAALLGCQSDSNNNNSNQICWKFSPLSLTASSQPAAGDAAAATANNNNNTAPPSIFDEMWTSSLDAANLSTIVGFWYGSQTGNAEYICTQLYEMFITNERPEKESYKPSSKFIRDFIDQSNSAIKPSSQLVLLDTLNSFVKKDMLGSIVTTRYTCVHVIVTSTHGDGDFPDNASRVKKYLNNAASVLITPAASATQYAKLLPCNFHFSVLALGDTNYSKFAEAGNLMNRKFKECGTSCFKGIECADDGIGLELVVDPYLKKVWIPLEKQLDTILSLNHNIYCEGTSFGSPAIPSPLAPTTSTTSAKNDNNNNINGKNTNNNEPGATSSSSTAVGQQKEDTTMTSNNNNINASSSPFSNQQEPSYDVSTVILFAPSALVHAGALQSVLVNAGLHGSNSLPILLPLRSYAPIHFDDDDDENEANNKNVTQSNNNNNHHQHDPRSCASVQRLPRAKNLFIITSTDAVWWDVPTTKQEDTKNTTADNDNNTETTTPIDGNDKTTTTSSTTTKRTLQQADFEEVCSRVKTFAVFDIEESFCKQQQLLQTAAARALCLPQTTESFSAFSGAIASSHHQQQQQQQDEARCAFTSWLRSLARWMIPRTLTDASSSSPLLAFQKNIEGGRNKNKSSSSSSSSADFTATMVDKITDAVNNIVDGVIHGHHERGMLAPVSSTSAATASNNNNTNNASSSSAASTKSAGQALHILSLKRTVVFFSRSSVEEQPNEFGLGHEGDQFIRDADLLMTQSKSEISSHKSLHGQSLAEDVARGLVSSSLRGLDVEVAEVGSFKTAGFPRKAVFVFVVGPDSSRGLQRLITYINSILATTSAGVARQQKSNNNMNNKNNNNNNASTAAAGAQQQRHFDTTTTSASSPGAMMAHPFRGLSFTILGIDWLHRSSQEYGGALELELLLQEAGATKIHPTGLARTGTIDSVVSRWRKSLKQNIEICGPVAGYVETTSAKEDAAGTTDHKKSNKNGDSISSRSSKTDKKNQHHMKKSSCSFESMPGESPHHSRSNTMMSSTHNDDDDEEDDDDDSSTYSSDEKETLTPPSSSIKRRVPSPPNHNKTTNSRNYHNNNNNNNASNSAVAAVVNASSWEPWISIRPTPAPLAAKTSVSIVVALSLTGFSKWIARKCSIEARILGYNIAFVGSISSAEDFLSLPTSSVVILCGLRSPKKLLRGLARLQASRSDVLSDLSFGCLGVVSSGASSTSVNNEENNNSSSKAASARNNDHIIEKSFAVVPGLELCSHLELCGAHRVFPNAAVDSPTGAESKGLLWLRGVLTSFSRITARRQFLLNQRLPSIPQLVTTLADSETQKLKEKELDKQKTISFIFTSTLTQSIARDMVEEASVRKFLPRAIPYHAFREIANPLIINKDGSGDSSSSSAFSSIVVFLCDETTPSNSRAISNFALALSKSSVLRNASESRVVIFGIGDRSASNNTNDEDNQKDAPTGSPSTSTSTSTSIVCPNTSSLASTVQKHMNPLFSFRSVDSNDPNIVLGIQGFRDDFFFHALKSYEERTKSHLSSENLSLLGNAKNSNESSNNNNNNNNNNNHKMMIFKDTMTDDDGTARDSSNHMRVNANIQQQQQQGRAISFNDRKDIVIADDRHPNKSNDGNKTVTTNNNAESAATDSLRGGSTVDEEQNRKNTVDEDEEMENMANEWFTGKVVHAQTLTSEVTNPPVIFMLFEVRPKNKDSSLSSIVWSPGDAIQLLPENNSKEIDQILQMLEIDGDTPFLPSSDPSVAKEGTSRFPKAPIYSKLEFPITCREVMKRFLSLKVHNREVCLMMERYVTDPRHRGVIRDVLDHISASRSATSSSTVIASGSSGSTPLLVDVLEQIKESVKKIPFRGFVETLPVLQARSYSITTSHLADPDHIGIAFKVVKTGVCTRWLQRLGQIANSVDSNTGEPVVVEIPIRLRLAPEFRMPRKMDVPMILIGPGTGVAPFMSFLSQREAELQNMIMAQHNKEKPNNSNSSQQQELLRRIANKVLSSAGSINLYFGCRSKYHDYLFEGDLVEWKQAGVLASLNVAFSQDSNGGVWYGGLYVQDLLREAGLELCRMILEQEAHVYVCGDASSMAKDVHQVLADILVEFRGMSQAQAHSQLKQMEDSGAYQRDIWG